VQCSATCLASFEIVLRALAAFASSTELKKGSRFCFIAAVQGPNLDAPPSEWRFVKWWKEMLLPNLACPSLQTNGVRYAPSGLKPVLLQKARDHQAATIRAEVVTLAAAAGHEVLFLPPHHSDLNPIEMLKAEEAESDKEDDDTAELTDDDEQKGYDCTDDDSDMLLDDEKLA